MAPRIEEATVTKTASFYPITYFALWGNLAILCRDRGYARGLVRLGTIDAGMDALSRSGPLNATIERVDP